MARTTSTPALVSVHEMTTSESIGRLRSLLQRLPASRSALRVTAVSRYVADALIAMGYPSDRVVVVHNGIERSTPRTEKSAARVRLGIPERVLVFLVAGRLTRWKGQLVALEAFDRFGKNHPDVDARLLVVGGPFEADDLAYEAELRRRIAASPTPECIDVYGHRSDIEVFYDAADVVLVPSIEPDPFPTVVLEAGLAGRPVIVTDLGGAKEAVLDGVSGLVVPPTAECFESAMTRVADPGWRCRAGDAALRHMESEFSRHRFAESMFAEWSTTVRRGRLEVGPNDAQ